MNLDTGPTGTGKINKRLSEQSTTDPNGSPFCVLCHKDVKQTESRALVALFTKTQKVMPFFSESRDILSFPEHFCEIPARFHQIFAEKSQNPSKNANEMK